MGPLDHPASAYGVDKRPGESVCLAGMEAQVHGTMERLAREQTGKQCVASDLLSICRNIHSFP